MSRMQNIRELEGALLDAAVVRICADKRISCGKWGPWIEDGSIAGHGQSGRPYSPSSEWRDGGPIIERERISITQWAIDPPTGSEWHANIARPEASWNEYGPTPLIAAMRAYVASKFGDEIELP